MHLRTCCSLACSSVSVLCVPCHKSFLQPSPFWFAEPRQTSLSSQNRKGVCVWGCICVEVPNLLGACLPCCRCSSTISPFVFQCFFVLVPVVCSSVCHVHCSCDYFFFMQPLGQALCSPCKEDPVPPVAVNRHFRLPHCLHQVHWSHRSGVCWRPPLRLLLQVGLLRRQEGRIYPVLPLRLEVRKRMLFLPSQTDCEDCDVFQCFTHWSACILDIHLNLCCSCGS